MGKIQINTHYLNDNWDYINNYTDEYIKTFPESQKVSLPHTNIELPYNNFSETLYQFVSSYQNIFELEKKTNKRYILHFEGVMEYADVYLNKKLVTSHKGGYTPFKVDITKQLKNGENTLFVMVDSTERKDIPPHGYVVDFLTYGGIYREVYIEEVEKNYISDALVHVENDELNVRMFLDIQKQKDTIFKYNIYKDDQLVYFFEREYNLKKADVLVNERIYLDQWSLEEPNLYELEILMDDQVAYKSRFANRHIKMTKEGFFLNDKKIKLIGLNRHQSFPYTGYAMPSNSQKKDADILKYELGCNVVRSSHYPPSKYFLDRCDEIGLLVFNEIPGWQHIGDESWQDIAKENVKEMILRDYNHPSVFIWGVRINESPDNDTFYKETNRIAKFYDTTRPTGGVRDFAGSHLFEDVYTINDFVHRGNNKGLRRPRSMSKKNVPYLVTEYNGHMYPTKKFDSELRLENHVKRHLNVQNASFKTPSTSGAIGWCMFDYNTHKDFGSNDRICYHGVMDMFRIPKPAAGVYRSQSNTEPYMEIVNDLKIGERQASELKETLVLTNVDSIKFYINDDYVGEFLPSEQYRHLPHPPIIVDDFIGNMIHKNESFTSIDADTMKEVFLYGANHGGKTNFTHKLRMGLIMLKNGISMNKLGKLAEKYVGKWGLESCEYKFEGIKDSVVVIEKTIGTSHQSHLEVTLDDSVLEETTTYETTRVVVKKVDEHNRTLRFASDALEVKVEGPLDLIGPSKLSLIGGSIGFFLKTKHEKGIAKVTILSNYHEPKVLEIEVK